MTDNKHNHDDNSPLPAQRSGEGPGVRAGIHQFPPEERSLILAEMVTHVEDLIEYVYGEQAQTFISQFHSTLDGITDQEEMAHAIERQRRYFSILARARMYIHPIID